MAVPGLVAEVQKHREAKRAARAQAATPLPAVARVKTPPAKRDEVADLDAAFRKSLFGLLQEHLPRLGALLSSPDDKIAQETWKTCLQHGLVARQAGGPGGGAAGPVKMVFHFADGDPPPKDVTPRG